MLLPKRAAAFWEGPERFRGRNRESRSREAAGRRNYPEAVPNEMSGRKGMWGEARGPFTGHRDTRTGELCRVQVGVLLKTQSKEYSV
jgi:hypothetical protein